MTVNIIFAVIGVVLLLIALVGGILYERYRRSKGIKKDGPNLFERATQQFNDEFKRYDEKKALKAKNKADAKKSSNKDEKARTKIKLKNDLEDEKTQAKKYQEILEESKDNKK